MNHPRPPEGPCFEWLDAFEGFFTIERRSPTLDGSVPLRAVQGCVPFLQGNAYGFQLVLRHPIELVRRFGVYSLAKGDVLLRRHRSALPRLLAQGFLIPHGYWYHQLASGPVRIDSRFHRGPRVTLFTGLLVRPRKGVWIRVTAAQNRRNTLFEVSEYVVADSDRFVPILLTLTFSRHVSSITLSGELGCLGPLVPDVRLHLDELCHAPELARAHVEFYDAEYFERKRREVTKKYRSMVSRLEDTPSEPPVRWRVVRAGPCNVFAASVEHVFTAEGRSPAPQPLEYAVFPNLVDFRIHFDGHTLRLDYDRSQLAQRVSALEALWTSVFGPGFIDAHRGAIWYLTKYWTQHPPGEPHFFVKPWAFFQTPPGWSCLLDGHHGDGFDILRGVVSTDRFHAAPAVFQVHLRNRWIEVPEGTPLLNIVPLPRTLLNSHIRQVGFLDRPIDAQTRPTNSAR